MIKLEFYNGTEWVSAGQFLSEKVAWMSPGDDNINYRTVDQHGLVLTDNSISTETFTRT